VNWFQQNRWLGTFMIVFGVAVVAAAYFFFSAKSGYDTTLARFNQLASEKGRLERLDPFPTEANYKKMQGHLANYRTALDKVKAELTTRILPVPELAPNQFQSRLRQAMLMTAEKARANKVRLPNEFALGFDEYTAELPRSRAMASLLGQQLSQIELLMNILLEARVDRVSAFTRTMSPEELEIPTTATPTPTPTPKPGAPGGANMVERTVVDLTFVAAPSAARKVLNQISTAEQQFYIIRVLHVRNEKDKGPPREQGTPAPIPTPAGPAKPAPAPALNFIVGNEHIETSAKIELIRFNF
jgi:hypothetical protein